MSDAEIFRRQIPTSTDPARLEREARMAEDKAMTVLERMAKAFYECADRECSYVGRFQIKSWDGGNPRTVFDGEFDIVAAMRAALQAARGLPNTVLSVAQATGMRPSEVDLAVTHWIDAILTEQSK